MGSSPQLHNYTPRVAEYVLGMDEDSHNESTDELVIKPDFSVKFPSKILDELNWKTKTKLMIIEYDADLQELTLGKKMTGEEAVKMMHKIADGFI